MTNPALNRIPSSHKLPFHIVVYVCVYTHTYTKLHSRKHHQDKQPYSLNQFVLNISFTFSLLFISLSLHPPHKQIYKVYKRLEKTITKVPAG